MNQMVMIFLTDTENKRQKLPELLPDLVELLYIPENEKHLKSGAWVFQESLTNLPWMCKVEQ